jgi:hypothetical protein
MRKLSLLLAFLAGSASLALLSVAQLIWARSEASFYAHLAFAIVLLGRLLLVARKASMRALGIAVVVAALLAALMPVENRLSAISSIASRNAGEPRIAGEIISAFGLTDLLMSIGMLWLLYAVLLMAYAFGMRHWFLRTSRASE